MYVSLDRTAPNDTVPSVRHRWTLALPPWRQRPRVALARANVVGAGSGVVLAVSAWLSGALPSGDPAGWTVPYIAGLVCWVAGGAGIALAWIRSPASLWWKAAWALPLLFSPPLGSRDVYAYACQGWLWLNGFDVYTMGVADGGCPWASSVPELWWHTPAPYGPLAIVLSGLAAATGGQLAAVAVLRAFAVAGAALAAWWLPKVGAGPGVVLLGVVTPLVLVHGVSGAHNDMLVAAFIIGGLAAARAASDGERSAPIAASGGERSAPKGATEARRAFKRAVLAGLAIGLAVAIKVTAIVALPFVLILLGRKWWAALTGAVTAFAALTVATGLGFGWVGAVRHTAGLAQWSSVPTAIGMAFGYLVGPQAIPIARALGLVVLAALGVFFVRMAWLDRRRAVVACGGMLAATALLGPVFYPWYALAALGVLAAARVPPKWLITATLMCTFLTLPNGHGIPALTKAVGAYAVTAAVVAAVAVAIRTVRKRRPGPAA